MTGRLEAGAYPIPGIKRITSQRQGACGRIWQALGQKEITGAEKVYQVLKRQFDSIGTTPTI